MAQITPSATNPRLTSQGFKTPFRLIADDEQQAAALAHFAASEMKARTIAIVDDRTAYGQVLADLVGKVAGEIGLKIVAREFTNDKATVFNDILTRVRATTPDLVFYGGMDSQAGPMAKQMKQLGIKAPLLSGDGACSPEFIRLAGAAADILTCSMAGEAVEKMPMGTAFAARYKGRFGQDVQVYSPYTYDAVYVLSDAIARAGKADRASILAALRTTNYAGLTGPIAFDEKGDIKGGAVSMFNVKGGNLTHLTTVRLSSPKIRRPSPGRSP